MFLNSNKDMEGFKNIKYEELPRFGSKFLEPIDEMIRNFDNMRMSRFSEDYLVVPLENIIDERELLENSGSLPLSKSVSKPNKHFVSGAARKTIHYTKSEDEDTFDSFANGYSANFQAHAPDSNLALKRSNRYIVPYVAPPPESSTT